MKTLSIIALTLTLIGLGSETARAQSYIIESKVLLAAAITTQGGEVTTTSSNGTVVKRQQLVVKSFTNKEVIAIMFQRGLMGSSSSGWVLVQLTAANGSGGFYASKLGSAPVAVPADLLTMPVIGQGIKSGTETTNPNGNTYLGITDLALSTGTVHGQPVSGISTNGVRTATVTVQNVPYLIDSVSSAFSFTGGNSSEIVRGSLSIGSAKVATITALP